MATLKNHILPLVAGLLITVGLALSCNNPQSNARGHKKTLSATDSLINKGGAVADSGNQKGAQLVASNDCLTCHKIKGKLIGPSFEEITEKYQFNEGNISNLVFGIRNGSKGIWGEERMTPHPNVTPRDAEEMVRYIFSLKKN